MLVERGVDRDAPQPKWKPLSATVTATRELFDNPGVGGDSWATENAMLLIFAALAVRRYRNRSV